ncbi:hypothetical protein QW131_12985 [Roseibium salinum]|nr:hypothetical protein [Roseibium salinum]
MLPVVSAEAVKSPASSTAWTWAAKSLLEGLHPQIDQGAAEMAHDAFGGGGLNEENQRGGHEHEGTDHGGQRRSDMNTPIKSQVPACMLKSVA